VWGQGFPPPLFANVFTVLEQLDLDGRRFNAIWFRRTELLPKEVRLAYRPVADDYNGVRRVQLIVEHMGQS
jgi:single-stranded-DNA-specific exonuclease